MTRKEKKNGRHWGKRAAAGLLAGILALGAPAAVLADTTTTLTTKIPSVHTVDLDIGANGSVVIDGTRYRGEAKVEVGRLMEQTYQLDPDGGYRVESVSYDGEDVTDEAAGGSYQAPALNEDGITLSVRFRWVPVYVPDPTPSPTPEPVPEGYPDGSIRNPDGSIETPNGTIIREDGTIVLPDGTELSPDEEGNRPSIDKDNTVTDCSGTVIDRDGNLILPGEDPDSTRDDIRVEKWEGKKAPSYDPDTVSALTKEGNRVVYPDGTALEPDAGSLVERDGTVTEPDGTVYRTDGSVQAADGSFLVPGTPVLDGDGSGTRGNQVRAALTEASAGAEGYDYVISANKDCIYEKDYLKVNKNVGETETAFSYIPQGALHAWNRTSEDGTKVFSPWSNIKKIVIKG